MPDNRALLKVHVLGAKGDLTSPMSVPDAASQDTFAGAGSLIPPYDPEACVRLVEHSSAIRQNIDAYATNIDGFGHRFDGVVDLESDDAWSTVETSLLLAQVNDDAAVPPTEAEVDARMEIVRERIRIDRARAQAWFDNCCQEHSFVDLRRRTRFDLEATGNAYWELLRDGEGRPVELVFVPSSTVRLMPIDKELVPITVQERGPDWEFAEKSRLRRFRRYVQLASATTVYFKQYADPRTISSRTGRVYKSPAELRREEPEIPPATELVHFTVFSPASPYGVPRWIGGLPSVLGSRKMEEVNLLYFDNKSIPPLAVLVSGGSLNQGTVDRLERYIEDELKGASNFHKILVLEADGPGMDPEYSAAAGKMRIEIKPLTDTQLSDALFQGYDERNIDKVGGTFRVPRLLRGDTRDFNRACYSQDTEVLTIHGWKKHDEIWIDEPIATVDPDSGSVLFETPKELHRYEYTGDMIRLVGVGTDVLVTPEHKMLVRTKGGGWAPVAAESLVDRRRIVVRSAATRFESGTSPTDFVLPKSCQIERGHSHDPILFDRFMEFLGYFCSDGGTLDTDHPSAPYLVFLRQKKSPGVAKMQECIEALGWEYSVSTKVDETVVYTISNRCLRDWLRRCGVGQKGRMLPYEIFEMLDERTAKILFSALMLGDGSWAANEREYSGAYYTSSSILAGQVQALAVLLGYRAHVRWSEGGHCFRVTLCGRNTSSLKDAAERVPYSGEVFCFSTRTGYYVTRRNGKVAIQGNTSEAALEFCESQVFAPERESFDYWVNKHLMTELHYSFVEFVSNGPIRANPEAMSNIVKNLAPYLPVATVAKLSEDIFKRNFPDISADWGKRPMQVTLAAMAQGLVGLDDVELPEGEESPEGALPALPAEEGELPQEGQQPPAVPTAFRGSLVAEARRMLRLRDALRLEVARRASREIYGDEFKGHGLEDDDVGLDGK